jgi:hypothetical protein
MKRVNAQANSLATRIRAAFLRTQDERDIPYDWSVEEINSYVEFVRQATVPFRLPARLLEGLRSRRWMRQVEGLLVRLG